MDLCNGLVVCVALKGDQKGHHQVGGPIEHRHALTVSQWMAGFAFQTLWRRYPLNGSILHAGALASRNFAI